MIRVFIGTDQRQGPADLVVEHTIRKWATTDVEITFMRAGDPGWDDWNRGWYPWVKPKQNGNWGTAFACFRMAVPELCEFEGRAIYLDSDMILCRDIKELWDLGDDAPAPWLVTSHKVMDVCVIDCGAMKGKAWWPSLDEMRPSGNMLATYRMRLVNHGMVTSTLPARWNRRDHYVEGDTALLHFTNVSTQPWRPDEDGMEYHTHPEAVCKRIWEVQLAQAEAARMA